ncbi:SAC3/GANP/Nin1/mts3/eIF-3 p25 family protein, partial [Trifolium medium]|nr:SAC3/GANP/Nin1/mts3/eIF-3 p25 family protein [Trifolium medium]
MEFTLAMDHVVNSGLGQRNPSFGVGLSALRSGIDNIALASLHCGLQNNQGLPVAHTANWLAMEDEDIEGLLEYHGFLIKAFGEPYMVKEGLFLNADTEYPTKCSKLVHKK